MPWPTWTSRPTSAAPGTTCGRARATSASPAISAARLVLSGTNSTGFTGSFTVQAGELLVANNQALGNATGVTVGTNNVGNPGQCLVLGNNIGTISGKTLNFNGAVQGFGSQGAIRSLGGTNEWAGTVTFTNNWARWAVDSGTLTINGAIGQDAAGRGMDKIGAGTLVFAGSTSNTYTGNTNIYEGTLRLAKTGGAHSHRHRLQLPADRQRPGHGRRGPGRTGRAEPDRRRRAAGDPAPAASWT